MEIRFLDPAVNDLAASKLRSASEIFFSQCQLAVPIAESIEGRSRWKHTQRLFDKSKLQAQKRAFTIMRIGRERYQGVFRDAEQPVLIRHGASTAAELGQLKTERKLLPCTQTSLRG